MERVPVIDVSLKSNQQMLETWFEHIFKSKIGQMDLKRVNQLVFDFRFNLKANITVIFQCVG